MRQKWEHFSKDDILKSFNPTFTHKIRLLELKWLLYLKIKYGKYHIQDSQEIIGKKGEIMSNVMEEYEKMGYCPNCRKLTAIRIIKSHKLLNYVLKNPKCAEMYHLSDEEIKILKEVVHGN